MKSVVKIFILFLVALGLIKAQEIHFSSPTNGQTVTYTALGATATTVPVNFSSSSTLSYPSPIRSMTILDIGGGNRYNSLEGDGIPQWFYLSPGTYTWTVELHEWFSGMDHFVLTASQTITFYVKHTLTVSNNNGSGNVYIDGSSVGSGSSVYKFTGDNLSVEAIDQTDYIWNTSGINNSAWGRSPMSGGYSPLSGGSSRSYNYTVAYNDNGADIQAALRPYENVTFQNGFVGVGNGGTISVSGSAYSSPAADFRVIQSNPIIAAAQSQVINGIQFTFSQWSNGSNSASTTFYPGSNVTYTASFTGKPTNNGEYIHFGTTAGQPIVIYWTDNPNSNVTSYQIWRKVKHNGVMGSAVNIATVSSGVGSYTDYEYLLTSSYSNDLLYYDVRAYYSTEGTYSTEDYVAVYGEMNLMTFKETKMQASLLSEVPADYKIENYPNPFNPTTKITYQLPEKGNVVLKIYDALGKEIRTLVNSTKEAGYYSIDFDASDLPSGVYLYQIQAGKFNQSKKMLLVK